MKKFLLFLLLPCISYGQVQIGDDINGEELTDFASIVSLSNDGSIVAIGAPFNDGNGNNSGHVRVYENQGGSWIQIGQDIDGEAEFDESGEGISLSGDGRIVAIGTSNNDGNGDNSGHVRVYENQGGTWTQIGQDIDGEAAVDLSGVSVCLSSDGSIVAIGAPFNDGNGDIAGHVRVYENQGGTWVQIGQDIDGEAAADRSGSSVSLSSDGSMVAVGASNNGGNGDIAGHVRVYENQGGSWIQLGQDIDGEGAADQSGASVSLSSDGSMVAIGAPFNDGNGPNAGHVRVYENQEGTWVQIGQDIDGEAAGDRSGSSVSLSSDGSIVAIGARSNSTNVTDSGHVRMYKNQGNDWVQVGEDIDGDSEEDSFGRTVSLSSDGRTVTSGGFGNAGYERVFDLTGVLSTQESSLTNFSIYPNPAENAFTLSVSDSETLQKATIYNSLGQEVLNTSQTNIDVSSLSKGVYVVEIQTSTGKGSVKLIIH